MKFRRPIQGRLLPMPLSVLGLDLIEHCVDGVCMFSQDEELLVFSIEPDNSVSEDRLVFGFEVIEEGSAADVSCFADVLNIDGVITVLEYKGRGGIGEFAVGL